MRTAVGELLGRDIIVPVWDQTRDNGGNFEYQVSAFALVRLNAFNLSGQGWFTFTYEGEVTCYNHAPVAIPANIILDEDGSAIFSLAASDADGDSLTFTIIVQPEHGVITRPAQLQLVELVG